MRTSTENGKTRVACRIDHVTCRAPPLRSQMWRKIRWFNVKRSILIFEYRIDMTKQVTKKIWVDACPIFWQWQCNNTSRSPASQDTTIVTHLTLLYDESSTLSVSKMHIFFKILYYRPLTRRCKRSVFCASKGKCSLFYGPRKRGKTELLLTYKVTIHPNSM